MFAGDISSSVRLMEQLVDILDAQLQELKHDDKDTAGRSFNKVQYTPCLVVWFFFNFFLWGHMIDAWFDKVCKSPKPQQFWFDSLCGRCF